MATSNIYFHGVFFYKDVEYVIFMVYLEKSDEGHIT